MEDPDRAHHEAVFGFWRALAQQGSPPAGVVASPSPLATLLRLYGPSGPLRAVGVAAGGRPEEASVHLSLPDPFLPRAAAGAIRVGGTEYPYTLRWAAGAVGAKVAFAEVLPCADVYGVVLPPRSQLAASIAARLYERAPAPRANLDPIAQAVWDLVRPGWGLPLVARCLTALWRLPGGNPLASERPAVAAAALLWLVGRISGARIAQVRLAKDFGAEAAALKRAAAELGDALGMSIGQPW